MNERWIDEWMSKQMSKQIDKQIGKQTNNKRFVLKKGQIDILEVLYWCRFGVLVVLGWITKPYKPNFNKTEKNGVSFCMQECCS